MFFSCSSCGTRLQLPDEQVHHRVVTIRCTACDQVMSVRDPTGRHARPTIDRWFVAVGGQQKGPLTTTEVEVLIGQGRVDARSYAWQEGMGQWTRAGEIAGLARLFAARLLLVSEPREEVLAPKVDPEADAKVLAETVASARAQADAELQARKAAEAEGKAKLEREKAERAAAEEQVKAAQRAAELARLKMAIGDTPLPVAGASLVVTPRSDDDADRDRSDAELRAFREELTGDLPHDPHRRKRWLWVGVAAVVAVAVLVGVLLNGPSERVPIPESMAAPTKKPYESAVRIEAKESPRPVTVEPPAAEDTAVSAPTADVGSVGSGGGGADAANAAVKVDGKPAERKGAAAGLVIPAPDAAPLTLGGERKLVLEEDELGKSETAVEYDPGVAARQKAAEDAARQESARADALREEVTVAFGKKKAQLAKCSGGAQERVKVVFTVGANGTTSDTQVSGSDNAVKLQCIREILGRSVFPAGDSAQTYSQTLVL